MATFDPAATDETWHPIPSLPGFELSNRLRIRRFVTAGREPLADGPADVVIHVYADRRPHFSAFYGTVWLSHVVAEVAHGPRPPGLLVRHMDDDPSNNDPANLAYGTYAQNAADARRNGRTYKRTRPYHRFTEAEKDEIAQRFQDGMTIGEIERQFKVSRQSVSHWVGGLRD